ncbi:hypothetical protein L6164_037486 [Bauhinia variegata]|uniref:Uncharacterized protein n=1 Tax=Bauhinia variegata TaxID=167791 RepID=A0ACB9KKE3_BAUVA|nr:hypothetical protein L6164_037486 [Bauhinia variegata]
MQIVVRKGKRHEMTKAIYPIGDGRIEQIIRKVKMFKKSEILNSIWNWTLKIIISYLKRNQFAESKYPVADKRSQKLTADLEQVFKKFDVNGDGKISTSRFGSIMASLGEPTSEEELISIIKGVDFDSDRCINLDEFIKLHTKDVDSNEV